ncbi:hypothetical protein [Pontibacter arcticus]|uniref:Uncharacterized protein n=1 Tax=Pontibacter arcticus TaxID=2080288 RepID=A0A364RFK4_9BACT|nr:hypothetical protein [Pontibacter arcticus]RAU83047.1 hypothetical protein DP923_07390 [Pontibacter arcticus]
MNKNLLLLLCCVQFLLIACEKEDAASKMKIKFSDPQAIIYKEAGANSTASNSTTTNASQADDASKLFQIDKQGNVTAVIEGVDVSLVYPFSDGLIIYLSSGEIYSVYLDNSYLQLPSNVGDFSGENDNGDLFFSNGYFLRKSSHAIEKVQTTLTMPYIQYVTGNFAILSGDNITQAFNTVSNERFNIGNCSSQLVALSRERALVKGCEGTSVMDMKTGSKSEADIFTMNGEAIYTGNGAIVLTPEAANMANIYDQGVYGLGFIDTNGKMVLLSNEGFKPGSMSCMNCGEPNTVLFASGNYYIVRELDKVSVVRKGDISKKVILTGYNVTSVSINNNKVYFIAEDKYGVRIAGVYNLLDNSTQMLETQEEFDRVFTLK